MSGRNLRKVLGDRENALPPPAESDEEYEPLYTKTSGASNFSRYQGLELNSDGPESQDSEESEHDSPKPVQEPQPVKKKKNNKKKRKRKAVPKSNEDELDEVDKSLREVNELLGTVELAEAPCSSTEAATRPSLMQVQAKHLNVQNELKRWFGADVIQDKDKKHGRHGPRLLKKVQLVNMEEYLPLLKKEGLSMSINRREGGATYFTFDHSTEYQRQRRSVLAQVLRSGENDAMFLEADRGKQVEALIEVGDYFFAIEQYNGANRLLEQAVAYMHYVSHPSFNLCDMNTRLEYRYLENRPFFIAVLKYLHVLTNKACHRTALELAKMLLNLEPSDPLAVILIIDTLALRAREHQWLVATIDNWMAERSAGYLYNMKYSYALALFHVKKKSGDTSEASSKLESAFLNFPSCLMEILKFANHVPEPRLKEHPFFNSWAMTTTPIKLRELITLYAKMTWAKWREPAVMEWLTTTAAGFLDRYDRDKELQEQAKRSVNERGTLYQKLPDEVLRHLSVIKPMANLLVDNTSLWPGFHQSGEEMRSGEDMSAGWGVAYGRVMPSVQTARSTDPKPPADTVDRYNYLTPRRPNTVHSVLQELSWSLLPNYDHRNDPPPPDLA